jgi:hypothetical protein
MSDSFTHADVVLFKPSGKYYSTESWAIPRGAVSPSDMDWSPDYHTIDGGSILVETQEPWGYPHLLVPASRDFFGPPGYLDSF